MYIYQELFIVMAMLQKAWCKWKKSWSNCTDSISIYFVILSVEATYCNELSHRNIKTWVRADHNIMYLLLWKPRSITFVFLFLVYGSSSNETTKQFGQKALYNVFNSGIILCGLLLKMFKKFLSNNRNMCKTFAFIP